MANLVLEVKGLSKEFTSEGGFLSKQKGTTIKAVNNANISVYEGETLGLVGESGCGKTTLGRCIVRGIDATSGEVIYYNKEGEGKNFLTVNKEDYKEIRQDIQMIFQDPYSSLDPRMTVFDIIREPLKVGNKYTKKEIEKKVKAIAEKTGLNINYLKRYPHAFSGGQRQRIGIARALVTVPRLIVCDEAVSALDVSIQAQIINLLKDLQKELKLTYIFISHDLSVVEHIADRVGVMYLGKVVELASTDELFSKPMHPYTEALLSSIPQPNPEIKEDRIRLQGEVPNPSHPPKGCHFHPRCSHCKDRCKKEMPDLQLMEDGRYVACHYAKELNLKGVY